jgi:hypothetical protein
MTHIIISQIVSSLMNIKGKPKTNAIKNEKIIVFFVPIKFEISPEISDANISETEATIILV